MDHPNLIVLCWMEEPISIERVKYYHKLQNLHTLARTSVQITVPIYNIQTAPILYNTHNSNSTPINTHTASVYNTQTANIYNFHLMQVQI